MLLPISVGFILQIEVIPKTAFWLFGTASLLAKDVGMFYSDNADSLRLACREVGWKQNNSVADVSKSNAVAERNLRSVLEGTRINLEQAGLHHSYWSYPARHWCMAHNIQDHPEIKSPGLERAQHSLWGSHRLLDWT